MMQSAAHSEIFDLTPLPPGHDPFVVDLDGFDGPIDLLLDLARREKFDLAQISVLTLADQYLNYIEHAKELRLEIAADYLVMAAWLTYLKSRLLLPEQPSKDGDLTPQDMADILAFQLRRLEAMRNSGYALMQRPMLGRDFHRGADRGERFITKQLQFDLKFHDLVNAYGRIIAEKQAGFYQPTPRKLFKVEDALERLAAMIGLARDWIGIEMFMPLDEIADYLIKKSAISSTFGAFLELAKQGQINLKQDKNFGPLYMRARKNEDDDV